MTETTAEEGLTAVRTPLTVMDRRERVIRPAAAISEALNRVTAAPRAWVVVVRARIRDGVPVILAVKVSISEEMGIDPIVRGPRIVERRLLFRVLGAGMICSDSVSVAK
jgi:hypothetical protein